MRLTTLAVSLTLGALHACIVACGTACSRPTASSGGSLDASAGSAPSTSSSSGAGGASDPILALAPDAMARAIYKELVDIDTSPEHGTTEAAHAMAAHLRAGGLSDVDVIGPSPTRMNVVARLRAAPAAAVDAKKPVLLLAHLDVVEARREDWSLPPFELTEKEGYYYGRGTLDDKAMAAIWVATLLRLAREHVALSRDVLLALTADEEEGEENGVAWLLENANAKPVNVSDAAYCLNEGGGGEIRGGRNVAHEVQLTEKLEESYELEVTERGGLAAEPRKENAIYRLAAGLARLAPLEFPFATLDVTRDYFTKMGAVESGPLAADLRALGATKSRDGRPDPRVAARVAAASPWFNSLLRTTCVATLADAGHGESSLPERASAVINCRIMPGDKLDAVLAAIVKTVADPRIKVTPKYHPAPAPPSPPLPELMTAFERITREMWPGAAVVTTMLPGATDGKYLRAAGIPTYGVSGLFYDLDDEREHGKDERLGVKQFEDGRVFLDRLVRALVLP